MSETPILDMELDPPDSESSQWVVWPAFIGLGLAVGLVAPFLKIKLPEPSMLDVFTLVVMVYVAIAVHEFGHLIAGKAVGFGFGGVNIGGFVFTRSGDRWLFRFVPGTLFRGYAYTLPRHGQAQPSDYAWMVAGGPIASVLFALVAAMLFMFNRSGGPRWITIMFWCATLFAVLSPLPFSTGLNRSDLSSLFQLLREPERSKSWMAVREIQTADSAGVRPRDWDRDLFQLMLANSGSEAENSHRNLMAYYRRTDEGDPAGAAIHLERALANSGTLPGKLRMLVFLEAGLVSAMFRQNATNARRWMERGREVSRPASTSVLEAVIAMCEDRYADAIKHFADANAFVEKRHARSGLTVLAKAKWAEYEARCRSALELGDRS